MEGIAVINRIEARNVDLREFQHQQTPAAPQHPIGFRQCQIDARHVADPEGNRIGIIMGIGEGQAFGIALHEVDPVGKLLGHPLAPDSQHLAVDIADSGRGAGGSGIQHPKGDIAGTAGHIQQF